MCRRFAWIRIAELRVKWERERVFMAGKRCEKG